jgi:hypothetical protein
MQALRASNPPLSPPRPDATQTAITPTTTIPVSSTTTTRDTPITPIPINTNTATITTTNFTTTTVTAATNANSITAASTSSNISTTSANLITATTTTISTTNTTDTSNSTITTSPTDSTITSTNNVTTNLVSSTIDITSPTTTATAANQSKSSSSSVDGKSSRAMLVDDVPYSEEEDEYNDDNYDEDEDADPPSSLPIRSAIPTKGILAPNSATTDRSRTGEYQSDDDDDGSEYAYDDDIVEKALASPEKNNDLAGDEDDDVRMQLSPALASDLDPLDSCELDAVLIARAQQVTVSAASHDTRLADMARELVRLTRAARGEAAEIAAPAPKTTPMRKLKQAPKMTPVPKAKARWSGGTNIKAKQVKQVKESTPVTRSLRQQVKQPTPVTSSLRRPGQGITPPGVSRHPRAPATKAVRTASTATASADATQESLRVLQVEIAKQATSTSFRGKESVELAPVSASDFLQPFGRRNIEGDPYHYRSRAAPQDDLALDLDGRQGGTHRDDIEDFCLQNARMSDGLNNIFGQLARVRKA